MAAPAYATDLTLIHACDAASASWTEPTGFTIGAITLPETDFFIHNTGCLSKNMSSVGKSGAIYNMASGQTIPTDGAFFAWLYFAAPNCLTAEASGGMQMFIGSATSAFRQFYVRGNDTYTYGGWVCVPVSYAAGLWDTSTGSPSGTLQYFGAGVDCPTAVPSKGNPLGIDICRFGRGEARFSGGEAANYATFAGFAAANDALTARWGLIQAIAGGYQWQGLITLGYGALVDFRDSNVALFIPVTKKVTSAFNKIEIRNASSRVDWTGISITQTSPTTTTSRGSLEVIDDCDVNFLNCTFTDMGTFIFKAASSVLSSVFRRCQAVTANGADLSSCIFDASAAAADTSALIWNVATDPNNYMDGCTFSKGTLAHHAIEFGLTSPTTMTLTNMTFSGFNASNSQNDSALHFKRTTGTVTVTLTGTSTPSYKSAGATIVFVTSSRTIKAIVQTGSGTKIASARVLLKTAADATGGFPYDDTVTITNSGTTATVAHTAHGMATNDKAVISGASLAANNGIFQITKTSDNAYTYTMGSSPGSSPTGTIKCSFVFLEGLTDTNGEISMSREIGADQAVIGWARKASDYYKPGPISGIVSSSANSTFAAILSADA